MAKAVFRPGEISLIDEKIFLDPPTSYPELGQEEEEEILPQEIEVYQGPTAEDLRREAEEFSQQWEVEKDRMIQSAQDEVDRLMRDADEAKEKKDAQALAEAESLKQSAQAEAEEIVEAARRQAEEMNAHAHSEYVSVKKEAEGQGRTAGFEAGYAEGKAEAERLILRVRKVLERAQDKRGEILQETEGEIIDLVLLMARKVVKVISETQQEVVRENVIQALRKVKDRGNIIIRVNTADLKLTTEHLKEFISLMEGGQSIQVAEDSSVDQGGCVIETDFGEVDARIANQLAELESRILEVSPIRSKLKTAVPSAASAGTAK